MGFACVRTEFLCFQFSNYEKFSSGRSNWNMRDNEVREVRLTSAYPRKRFATVPIS
jgi:hypothetical protein